MHRNFKAMVADYERQLITEALAASGGNQRRAAAALGTLPTTLHEKMKRLGLDRPAAGERGGRVGGTGMIELKNVEKTVAQGPSPTYLLRRIDLTIPEGDFVSIMGPSGAGKSTLLHILGIQDSAFAGEYVLRGQPVHKLGRKERLDLQKKHIGFVFQSYHLLDELTVAENLDLPLSYRDLPKAERQSLVADTLDRFQIVGKKDLYPRQLSGGQQQLVAVARAVIAKPSLLLADEPTGNLHSDQGREIMELFGRLNAEGTTVVQVTHSEANAAFGKRIVPPARRLAGERLKPRAAPPAAPDRMPPRPEHDFPRPHAPPAGRRRPARRVRGAAPAAQERGLRPALRGLAGGAVVGGRRREEFDARPDGPQLRARHDVGPRGPRPARPAEGARPHAAGGGDDGLGQRRPGGRGHAPRRARLRVEAVGERAARLHPAHAGRAARRAAAGRAPGGREPRAAHGRRRRRSSRPRTPCSRCWS